MNKEYRRAVLIRDIIALVTSAAWVMLFIAIIWKNVPATAVLTFIILTGTFSAGHMENRIKEIRTNMILAELHQTKRETRNLLNEFERVLIDNDLINIYNSK